MWKINSYQDAKKKYKENKYANAGLGDAQHVDSYTTRYKTITGNRY
jgi:hypothetical protein